MVVIAICVSGFIFLASYLIISRHEGSYINFLTPTFFLQFPIRYILEASHYILFGPSGSDFAYYFIYGVYGVSSLVFCFFYTVVKVRPLNLSVFTSTSGRLISDRKHAPYMFLFVSFLIYSPILIEYRDYIMSPRQIYEATRTGYGLIYFVSSLFLFLSYVIYLQVYGGKFSLRHMLFLLICVVGAFLHGSKGQLVELAFIYILDRIYIREKKIGFMKSVCAGIVGTFCLMGLFYAFYTGVEYTELAAKIISYSDYNRNAMMLIDAGDDGYHGRLMFETEFYSRIPRALFPDKPKDFGTFRLAEKYYPESFKLDQGVPAFGMGLYYADFGIFTAFILSIFAILSAVVTKYIVVSIKQYPSVGWMILLLFMSDFTLLPIGSGYLLPEHVFFALAISAVLMVRVRLR